MVASGRSDMPDGLIEAAVTDRTAMISVVIPAHDEAAGIGRLLDALRPGIDSGQLDVVVVPNGCTDRTAEIAREYPVTVVELSVGNKAGALNAGDEVVTAFPRYYVDADVVLSGEDLIVLSKSLRGDVIAVAPVRTIDSRDSSWVVRAYHRIWDQLQSTSQSLAGRGCYGVAEEGRRRWNAFPDLTADDGFVNSLFLSHERTNVDSVHTVVVAPRDTRSLLMRKRRSHRGNVELESTGRTVTNTTGWLQVLIRQPARLIDAPAYLVITLISRWLAHRDLRTGRVDWGADRSTRQAT